MEIDYAELAACSNFSFLKGASHPEELIKRAAELGYRALALSDEASLAGVVRAYSARLPQIRLIVGASFERCGVSVRLLAMNRQGYGQLCQLITATRRAAEKGSYVFDLSRLWRQSVSDCLALIHVNAPTGIEELSTPARWPLGDLKDLFGDRLSFGVRRLRQGFDHAEAACIRQASTQFGVAEVAIGDVWFHRRERQALADVVTAIRSHQTLAMAGGALHSNAERHLRTRQELSRLFSPDQLRRSWECAQRCEFDLGSLRYEYPDDLVPAGHTGRSWLRWRVEAGLTRRYPAGVPWAVRETIERELDLIAQLQFESYFLTVDDLVEFARSRSILCQGRGSAANSAVCYALGITEVDPARMAVLFERFLSKERAEPPDIDVDFEHERREEVIQYIYRRYGRERAALAATVICYRPRSALRDVAKAFGFKEAEIDHLSKALRAWHGQSLDEAEWMALGLPNHPRLRRVLKLAGELLGFPRHLSQHVGGFVIARRTLAEWVPVENAAMPERTVIQWDKDDLDVLGLLKVDVLGLGMLSAIRKAFDLINDAYGIHPPMTMADVPSEDPQTYRMIQKADTVGVFQIESRAQMSMLPRLKPQCFYDLVIEVALVRPGPIQGGMVHPYLKRRQGLEAIEYPSEAVQGVLQRTLGVPIFQEQVMQLAMVAAGFSGGEADQLRRSMAAWKKKGGLEQWRERWFHGLLSRGYSEAFAERSFRQILGFGEYGFPESHAASFALLVYVSAWLKCHHPAAFTAALLNSLPMGFYGPAQLVQDAKAHGVKVLPVDVLHSQTGASLEGDPPALRLGLVQIRGLASAAIERIVAARRSGGFATIAELADRASLSRSELLKLSTAGALRSLHSDRHQSAWQVLGLTAPNALWPKRELNEEGTPLLPVPTEGQLVVWDYQSVGLSVGRHPLALLRERVARFQHPYVTHAEFKQAAAGSRVALVGLVLIRQRPPTAKGVMFVTLEDHTGNANLVIWPKVAAQFKAPLREAVLLAAHGKVQREGEVVHLVVERVVDWSRELNALIEEPPLAQRPTIAAPQQKYPY